MPSTARPRLPPRRRPIGWAAAVLLSCCPWGPVGADPGGGADPDPVRAEDLVVPAGGHQLAGTVFLPRPGPPAAAVVFVHGAGPAVRDDGYRDLARHFARKGVAALIYDKRGCGASTGDWTRAGLADLADDALACVRLLRGRPDIDPARVGLWGLSQGASVVPLAAGRSPEVAFVIAVGGCLDFEGQMRYFRANVFRPLGHTPAALDVADKAFRLRIDLGSRIRTGSVPAPAAWRDACRFEFDLDQAAVWQRVRQPVFAAYGERDRHVPVAESSTALAAALARSGNRDFTLVIYPGASHSIGRTRTGELGEGWIGYVPEYLDDMTDWVREKTGGGGRPGGWPPRGRVPEPDRPAAADRHDRLRWYGSAPVQAVQFVVFAAVFLGGAAAGAVRLVRGRHPAALPRRAWRARAATAVSVLNVALLAGLAAVVYGLEDQWKPRYPGVLNWLPLAGSLSAGLTLALLASLAAGGRAPADSRRRRIGWTLFVTCALAFVPFLAYWNLLGLAWH